MYDLYQQFELITGEVPTQVAFHEHTQQVTFAELALQAQDYAQRLSHLGLSVGARCVVCLPNAISTAAIILAVWRVGGIPVLLNEQSPKEHFEHSIFKTQSKLAVTTDSVAGGMASPPCCVLSIAEISKINLPYRHQSLIPKYSAIPTGGTVDAASIVFTSGSTGLPKGVVQSKQTLLKCCRNVAEILGLNRNDNILCPVPWSFDYGFGQLLSTLLLGITQTIPPSSGPFDVCCCIDERRPTVLAGVPSFYANLLFGVSPVNDTDLTPIRLLTTTGSAMSRKLLGAVVDRFHTARLSLNYGLTESYRSTSLPPEMVYTDSASVGYPVPGVEIQIVREDGSRAAVGEIGEIVHSGSGVFQGYWDDPVSTDKQLRSLQASAEGIMRSDRALFTGDLGCVDDRGLLYFHGRKDRQIKSMGVRIGLEEIESRLSGHPFIAEVAAIAVMHEYFGEIIKVIFTLSSDHGFSLRSIDRALRLYSKEHLGYYMMPREFLCVEQMPRTISGKIDYQQLEKFALKRTPSRQFA